MEKIDLIREGIDLLFLLQTDGSRENRIVDRCCRFLEEREQVILLSREDIDKIMSIAFYSFDSGNYEDFFRLVLKIQDNSQVEEALFDDIFRTFIEPNIDEFRMNYNRNKELLDRKLKGVFFREFDELEYYLIPTGKERRYLLWDKNKRRISESGYWKRKREDLKNDFSDYLLVEEYDMAKLMDRLRSAPTERKKYLLFLEEEQWQVSLQGFLIEKEFLEREDIQLLVGLGKVAEYLRETGAYIPWNISCPEEHFFQVKQELDQLHRERISQKRPENIKPLLTIAIPTWNRGRDAYENVIHCLQSNYDYEMEVIVSDNGSDEADETLEYYDKIKEINDSRLIYRHLPQNIGAARNFCHAIELSNARYTLLIADTDTVFIENIGKILSIIYREEYAMLIAMFRNEMEVELYRERAKAGQDAILNYMLTLNNITGLIINNSLFRSLKMRNYLESRKNNYAVAVYPQAVMHLLMGCYGDVQRFYIPIAEQKESKREQAKLNRSKDYYGEGAKENYLNSTIYVKKLGNRNVQYAYTIEGRLEQHKGFMEIFCDVYEIIPNQGFFIEMYDRLCRKTIFLCALNTVHTYFASGVSLEEGLKGFDKAGPACLTGLEEIYVFLDRGADEKYQALKAGIDHLMDSFRGQIIQYYRQNYDG